MKGENNCFAKGEWAFSAFLPERLKRSNPKNPVNPVLKYFYQNSQNILIKVLP
jgi:hypothetical protein